MANIGSVIYLFKRTGKKSHEKFFSALAKCNVNINNTTIGKKEVCFNCDIKHTFAREYHFGCKKEVAIYDFLQNLVLSVRADKLRTKDTMEMIREKVLAYPDESVFFDFDLRDQEIKADDIVLGESSTFAAFFKKRYGIELPAGMSARVSTLSSEIYMLSDEFPEKEHLRPSLFEDLKSRLYNPADLDEDNYPIWVMTKMKTLYENGVKDFMTEKDKGTFCAAVMEFGLNFKEMTNAKHDSLADKAKKAFNEGLKDYITRKTQPAETSLVPTLT